MVHSVEVLFDRDTDAAVRRIWEGLSGAGIRSQAANSSPTNRPHVTLTVAEDMAAGVNDALRVLLDMLPFDGLIGAPMLFGARSLILVRSFVPSAPLLELHREADRVCRPYLAGAPLPHTAPGQWTPHVTLARRVPPEQLPAALAVPGVAADLRCRVVGLRHWDGNARVEYPIS